MTIIQAVWLGLIQGLTEFLPVSSSGHLLLAEKIFGIANTSLLFSVLLHLGTLLAVVVVYRKRIWRMIRNIPDVVRHPLKNEFLLLVIATIPAVVAALVFDFDDAFSGEYLGFSFLITTLILWLSDLVSGLAPQVKKVGLPQAIVMGVMQAVAILPGVSRSGSCIAGGVSTGLSRKRAADFAFLMSIPAILGSAALEGYKLMKNPEVVTGSWAPILAGVAVSAVAGYLAIRLMLKIVRRVRLTWFGLYTGVLGVLVLLDQYMFHYFF